MACGEVITFYSYEGGVGRPMALASAATLLAQMGKRVLAIDFDVEAPGLLGYFETIDTGTSGTLGVIDFFAEIRERFDALHPVAPDTSPVQETWLAPGVEIELRKSLAASIDDARFYRRIIVDDPNLPGATAELWLMPGRYDESCPDRVGNFPWEAFYDAHPYFVEYLIDGLAARYDYVLIDSSTGTTDVSSFCTVLLPEKLVLVFRPNEQALHAAVHVGREAVELRKASPDLRPLPLFPLISRVENAEDALQRTWIHEARSRFEAVFREVYGITKGLTVYFDTVHIPHKNIHAGGEVIDAEREPVSEARSLVAQYRVFVEALQANNAVDAQEAMSPNSSAQRMAPATEQTTRLQADEATPPSMAPVTTDTLEIVGSRARVARPRLNQADSGGKSMQEVVGNGGSNTHRYQGALGPRQAPSPPTPVQVARVIQADHVDDLVRAIRELLDEEAKILGALDFTPGALATHTAPTAQPNLAELEQLESQVVRLSAINGDMHNKTDQLCSLLRDNPELRQRVLDGLDEYARSLIDGDETVSKDRLRLLELTAKAASFITLHLARRSRARRQSVDNASGGIRFHLDEQPPSVGDPTHLFTRTPSEHHDVLVIAPKGVHTDEEMYRFPVIKKDAPNGSKQKVGRYIDEPERLDAFDYGQRRALSVARPQEWGTAAVRATQRGPAFATLPPKPEPDPAAIELNVCYLINTQNLNFRNAWTAEEWNDAPGGVELPPAQGASHNELETLIAGPQGKVFRLLLNDVAAWSPGARVPLVAPSTNDAEERVQRELGCIESVDLRPHMEVWQQLRSGTVLGRVYFGDTRGPRIVPLVNITTLTRD